MSDTDTLQILMTFAAVCVVNGTAVAIVWIQGKTRADRTDAKIDEVGAGVSTAATDAATAATEAASAAQRVIPVSNGFAPAVVKALGEIRAEQIESAKERAADRVALGKALDLIGGHLGDHASADVRRKIE